MNTAVYGTFLIVFGFLAIVLWNSLFGTEKIRKQPDKPQATQSEQQRPNEKIGGSGVSPSETKSSDDIIADYTRWLAVFTALLVLATVALFASGERDVEVARQSAEAAKESADVARQALIISQRPHVRNSGFPWLWRPDLDRPEKYFFDISPIIENVGNTPATAKVVVDYALRETPLPDGFDFPYRSPPGNTVISPRGSVGMNNAVILDTDLLAVKEGKKFFYIWGTITYPDGFVGTPIHTTEFCTQIGRVIGNPLDPRDPGNPKGTTVEITFLVYREQNKAD
jgi:hypothetical protein